MIHRTRPFTWFLFEEGACPLPSARGVHELVCNHHYRGVDDDMKNCPPIICQPQYIVRNCYTYREVPIVHPIVNVNRNIIVNVPRHYYQPMTRNEVVDPGCPGCKTDK